MMKQLEPRPSQRKAILRAGAAFLGIFGLVPFAYSAGEEARRDIQYSQLLNDMGFFDFSERFLNTRITENGADRVTYNVQLADTLLSQNKFDDAKKIIDSVPKNSPEYYDGAGALGVYYFQHQDKEKALLYLEPMYEYYKKNKVDPSLHERPLAALLNTYYQTGKDSKAQELLEWTQGGDADRRASGFNKAMMQMSQADNLRQAEQRILDAYEHKIANAKTDKSKSSEITSLASKVSDLLDKIARKDGNVENNRKQLEDTLKRIGDLLGMDMDPVRRIYSMDAERRARMIRLKNRRQLNKNDLESLKKVSKDDWHSLMTAACMDFLGMQWGGQNIMTAYASAQCSRCFYLLGLYEDAAEEILRYADLYDAADAALEEINRKSESPSADAKYWSGKANKAIADSAYADRSKSSEKKQQAQTYYTRAFKYFGKLVKYYPGYPEILDAYEDFKLVTSRLSDLNPTKKASYQKEFAQVPVPKAPENKHLVSAWAEQNFISKQYDLVLEELLPVLSSHHGGPAGMSELLNKIVLSYAYLGDTLRASIFGSYMATSLEQDDFVSTALMNAGHLAWDQAGKEKDEVKAAQMRSDAMELYRNFLNVDLLNPMSANVALRVARERFNTIARVAEKLNSSSDQTVRARLRLEYDDAIENALNAYGLIFKNFGSNGAFIAEAYLRSADCYTLVDKFEDSVAMLRKYMEVGVDNPAVIAVARENISEMLSRQGAKLKDRAENMRESGEADGAAKADALLAESKKIYLDAVANLREFDKEQQAGRYKEAAKDPVFEKTVKRAAALLPWLYDGAGDQDKAIAEFRNYVKKYPKDSLTPAFLMRIGVIQVEQGKQEDARKTLTDLVAQYPDAAEAKNAKFYLARNLYQNGSQGAAVSLFESIVNSAEARNLSISSLRWLTDNLPSCSDPSQAKSACAIALKVGEQLLQKITDPNLLDWFSADRAAELTRDKAQQAKVLARIEQKILIGAGIAAAGCGDYAKSITYLERIELIDAKTPYFFEVHFAMAETYFKQGKNDDGRRELAKISTRASQLNDFATYNKAQVLCGESYLKDNAVNKADACFSIVALSADGGEEAGAPKKDASPEEMQYLEQAVYRYAYTSALLGKNAERDSASALYRKLWPEGKFLKDLDSLPASQAQ